MMVAGRELPRSAWWAVGAIVVCLAVLVAGGIWYTNITNAAQDRRWCEYLNSQSQEYRAVPPVTETGRRIAAAVERLRAEQGCA